MSIHVVPKDMKKSISVTQDAESKIRKADSADSLNTAAGAVPGADVVGYLAQLGQRWTDETTSMADASESLSTQMEKALNDFQTTDQATGAQGGKVIPN